MLLSEFHCGGAARVGEDSGEMESLSVVLRGSGYLELHFSLHVQFLYFAKYCSSREEERTLYHKIVKYPDSDRRYYILHTSIRKNYISSLTSDTIHNIFNICVYHV